MYARAESTGPELWSLGHLLSGESLGRPQRARRPGASPRPGVLFRPDRSLTASCKPAPRRAFSTLRARLGKEAALLLGEWLHVQGSAHTALGSPAPEQQFVVSQFVKSTDLCLHSPWVIGVLCVVNWVFTQGSCCFEVAEAAGRGNLVDAVILSGRRRNKF